MLFTIIGISLLTVAICLLINKTNPEFSMATSLIAGILIFVIIMINFTPIIEFINNTTNKFNLNSEYITVVIKALGICYLTEFAADSCKDAGFTALSSKVELGGKVAVILISLPLFENILDIAKDLVTLGN